MNKKNERETLLTPGKLSGNSWRIKIAGRTVVSESGLRKLSRALHLN